MERLLNAFMASPMNELDGLVTQVANVGNEDAVTVQQESGVLAPWSSQLTRAQAFL